MLFYNLNILEVMGIFPGTSSELVLFSLVSFIQWCRVKPNEEDSQDDTRDQKNETGGEEEEEKER